MSTHQLAATMYGATAMCPAAPRWKRPSYPPAVKIFVSSVLFLCVLVPNAASQPVFRVLGQVTTEKGEPIAGADVKVEAMFGYAAGTFAGQRLFSAKSDARGKWNVIGVKSGVWIFEVHARGYVPEVVALPIAILTTVSSRESGNSLTWTLVMKPEPMPDGPRGATLAAALESAREGRTDEVTAVLARVSESDGGAYLSGAARIAFVARAFDLAQSLYAKALQEDPSAYRTALGLAAGFLVKRDFDSASKAFDAARARTHDKDEVRFITIALADLATIKVR